MANQVSIKAIANKFTSECDSLSDYLQQQSNIFTGKFLSYSYDFAIIKIFKDFEELLLNTIIGIINNQAPYIQDGHGGFRKKSINKITPPGKNMGNVHALPGFLKPSSNKNMEQHVNQFESFSYIRVGGHYNSNVFIERNYFSSIKLQRKNGDKRQ